LAPVSVADKVVDDLCDFPSKVEVHNKKGHWR